jgi:hypothetical protein
MERDQERERERKRQKREKVLMVCVKERRGRQRGDEGDRTAIVSV